MNLKTILKMMKRFKKRLISTSIICALGFAIMITLSNAYISLNSSLNNYIKEYNYPNLEIKTSPSTIDRLSFLDNIEGVSDYSPQFIFDTVMKTSNNEYFSMRAITYDDTDFQKYYVWEEKKIKKDNVIYLEYKYAKENNIHAGDKISIKVQDKYKDFYVSKLISLPETFALSVAGDSWTLSSDFGYVYVSRSLLSNESKKAKDKTRSELNDQYAQLEGAEKEGQKAYDDLYDKIRSLSDYESQLNSSESNLTKAIIGLTKTKEELLFSSQDKKTSRKNLLKAKRDTETLINELENNKRSLQDVNNALNLYNTSIKEIKENRDELNNSQYGYFIKLLRYFPSSTSVGEVKKLMNYLKLFVDNYGTVEIPVELENTPLNDIDNFEYLADEIINDYAYIQSVDISEFLHNGPGDYLPEEYDKYVEYIDVLNKYTNGAAWDNLQQSYDTVYIKLGKYVNYIYLYRTLNLSSYISNSGVEIPVGQLFNYITQYDMLIEKLNQFSNGNDSMPISNIINEYDGAIQKLNNAEQNIYTERNNLINMLQQYGINEYEIDSNIETINNQIANCRTVLNHINEAISIIDNNSGDASVKTKQIAEEIDTILKQLNSSKYSLYKDINSKEEMLFSEWMESSRQIKDAKGKVEQALKDVNSQYNYEDYFNRIDIKYDKKANEEEIIKTIKENLAEQNVKIQKIIPYDNSLVKQRIDDNIIPVKRLSLFLPIVFYIIILNIVFLFINLIIKQCNRELGIIKALGYTSSKIRKLFMMLSLIISMVAILIGSMIGWALTHIITTYYKNFFPLPFISYRYDIKMYIIAIVSMVIVIQISTLFATKSIKKLSPTEVIASNTPEYDLKPEVFNKLKLAPMLKYSVVSLLRNYKRFIFGSICVSASVMMIFASLSLMSSEKYFYTELFDKRINYDAEIYMYDNVNDKFIEELHNLPFIKDVEVVSYFNKDIEYKDRKESVAINLINKKTKMINIYDKKDNVLAVEEDGIIIDYVTAEKLGVKKGDTVLIDSSEFKVTDISYQNIKFNQYTSIKSIDKFNTNDIKKVIIQINEGSEQKLLEFLQAKDDYLYTSFTSRTKKTIIEDCKLADFICSIIIGFSAIIGFIIIINTNLTSLIEQKRKICILKSIGYKNSAISKNWYSQSIIQLITSCLLGLPLGILITVKALDYLNNISHHYVFVNSFSNYIITIVLVFSYLTISHLICMREMKKWNIAIETKSKE